MPENPRDHVPDHARTDLYPLLEFLTRLTAERAAGSGDQHVRVVFGALAGYVRKLIDCDVFAAFLANDGPGGATLTASYVEGVPLAPRSRVSFGEHLVGVAAAERTTIVANDVSKDPRYVPVSDTIRSEMAVPLVARGRSVGVLNLQSIRIGAFGDRERRLLELVASRLALAFDSNQLLEELSRQNQVFKTLLEVSQEFSTVLALDKLMEVVAVVMRRLIDYDSYTLFEVQRDERGVARLQHLVSHRYDQRTQLDSVAIDQGIIGAAAQTGRPVLVSSTLTNAEYDATRSGIRSEVAVPLRVRDCVVGVLALESEREYFFIPEHVDALQVLASQLAAALENARLYKQVADANAKLEADLEQARRLQRHILLPEPPARLDVEIVAYNRPLFVVSGDFYDFSVTAEGPIDFLLGDVSGKGAAAALYGALVSGLCRSLRQHEQSPAALLEAVNNALADRQDDPSVYAVVTCAHLVPTTGELVVANSGLPPPLFGQGGVTQYLKVAGLPLGMFHGAEYESQNVKLGPGDFLVLASDGVYDCEDTSGTEFGTERLAQVVTDGAEGSAEALLSAIVDALQHHTAGAPIGDDQTIVIVRSPHAT